MSATVHFADQDGPRLYASEPTTPSFKVVLEYLNEGGANFVFRILPSASTVSLPPYLDGKLLRLRKDLPLVQNAKHELTSFNEHFAPLFTPGDVISFELIQLEGITPVLNAALRNFQRPHHRKHDFLPSDEPYGLLVTDMTPGPDDVLLQVKPKWLSQSPNAPPGSKRCRTCALRAHRRSQKVRTATDKQESCPLELVSSNPLERERSAGAITSDKQLQDYLIHKAQPVLNTLRKAQAELDRDGVLNISSSPDNTAGESLLDLCKAMTLRDCTLFLRRRGDHVEARLADLDVKQPEKLERWRQVESELIGGGWYTNQEGEESRRTLSPPTTRLAPELTIGFAYLTTLVAAGTLGARSKVPDIPDTDIRFTRWSTTDCQDKSAYGEVNIGIDVGTCHTMDVPFQTFSYDKTLTSILTGWWPLKPKDWANPTCKIVVYPLGMCMGPGWTPGAVNSFEPNTFVNVPITLKDWALPVDTYNATQAGYSETWREQVNTLNGNASLHDGIWMWSAGMICVPGAPQLGPDYVVPGSAAYDTYEPLQTPA